MGVGGNLRRAPTLRGRISTENAQKEPQEERRECLRLAPGPAASSAARSAGLRARELCRWPWGQPGPSVAQSRGAQRTGRVLGSAAPARVERAPCALRSQDGHPLPGCAFSLSQPGARPGAQPPPVRRGRHDEPSVRGGEPLTTCSSRCQYLL